jgi:hypothetical protein
MESRSMSPCSHEAALVSILSQINSFHNTKSCFSKSHFNIILPPSLGFPSDFLLSSLPTEAPYAFMLSPMRATCSDRLILLHLFIVVIFLMVCIFNFFLFTNLRTEWYIQFRPRNFLFRIYHWINTESHYDRSYTAFSNQRIDWH